MNRQELEAIVKSVSNKMRADDNTKLVTKYMEHLSWLLFLKVHEAMEREHELVDPSYVPVIDVEHRWSTWTKSATRRADELVAYVHESLIPYLRDLSGSPRAQVVAAIFQGVTAVMKSGFGLKEVIAEVDRIDFHAPQEVHTMSVVYESLLARLGNEAGWSGEFYTPRPIVQLMVQLVDPQLGERIYDPAAGSGGFIAEAFEHMRSLERTLEDRSLLQTGTFFGQESGELPYLLGTMNLVLHGLTSPVLARRNTLEEDVRAIPLDRQYEVVLTNPPFGGRENAQIQQNFPIRSLATEVLFIQHVIASLKDGGRCGIVVPDGILFDDDAGFRAVRKRLLTQCNVHTIVRLPHGTFLYTPHQRLNLMFFTKGPATKEIWYYEHPVPESRRHLKHPRYTKTKPLRYEEFQPILNWWHKRESNEWSWRVSIGNLDPDVLDLDLRHPDRPIEELVLSVSQLRDETEAAVEAVQAYTSQVTEVAAEVAANTHVARPLCALGELGILFNPENRDPRSNPDQSFTYVDLSAVDRGVITPGQSIAGETAPSRARRVIRTGDVIFSSVRPYLRGHAVVPAHLDGAIASTGFTVLRPPPGLNSDFLLLALMSPSTVRQCMEAMKGAHYPAVKLNRVKEILIIEPGSLDEQQHIVDAVWPALLALRNSRLSLSEQLAQLIDSVKDSEFTLLQGAFAPDDT